jgi:hypothetical protein
VIQGDFSAWLPDVLLDSFPEGTAPLALGRLRFLLASSRLDSNAPCLHPSTPYSVVVRLETTRTDSTRVHCVDPSGGTGLPFCLLATVEGAGGR